MLASGAAVRETKMGYLKADKHFNVPRSSLFCYVNDKDSLIKFYGLIRMDLCQLANQPVEKITSKIVSKMGLQGDTG